STANEHVGEFSAKEFTSATVIGTDGKRTTLAQTERLTGDPISNREATARLGADTIKFYQQKAIPNRAEIFNRQIRKDIAAHPGRYAVHAFGLLVLPQLAIPHEIHALIIGAEALNSANELQDDIN